MTITILDGGIGQELVLRAKQKPTGLWSTRVMLESPAMVREVHDDYFAAGAEIATTNTYAVHRDRLRRFDVEDQFAALQHAACRIAVEARDAFGAGRVAGAVGPTGWSYRPDLAPAVEQGAEIYAEVANIQSDYVDFLLFETMSSLREAESALMGGSTVDKPLWLAVSVHDDDGSRLRSGEPVVDIIPLLVHYQPEALLVNCSVPEAVSQAVPLLVAQGMPVGAYANGFRRISKAFTEAGASVDLLEAREDLDPDAYAEFAAGWINNGAQIIGGCCEVGPDHIKELARRFK
ncbi:MAG: homocysteine S-methyltransferase family protein [Gammaproteobacteria bacterium]|nr:homocysteine S-methyltransferase family protein [Gammaproteobacteria bacterium]